MWWRKRVGVLNFDPFPQPALLIIPCDLRVVREGILGDSRVCLGNWERKLLS